MSNVLSEHKRQQVLALGRLGWLRRIEDESGYRCSFGRVTGSVSAATYESYMSVG